MDAKMLSKLFQEMFTESLNETPIETFQELIVGPIRPNRTKFAKQTLREVAMKMKHEFEEEFLRIDIAFRKQSERFGWFGRTTFIEVENDIWGYPNKEIEKLCSVNSPLKVFISWIWGDWTKERSMFLNGQEGEKTYDECIYPDDFRLILLSHQEVISVMQQEFLIIIGQTRNDSIKFYVERWNGEEFVSDGILFEHDFAVK